jgi:aminoglycoside 6'-N-acetyltransferase
VDDLTFRPLTRNDFPHMSRWLAAPHVARWWMSPSDLGYVEEHYGPAIDGAAPTEYLVIELDGTPIGMIERYRVCDHPGWQATLGVLEQAEPPLHPAAGAGIDYFIGEEGLTGKGLGPRVIREFSGEVLERYPEAMFILAAPQQANRPSWRALERAGFARVWEGMLDSDDPSDAGPAYVYVLGRE